MGVLYVSYRCQQWWFLWLAQIDAVFFQSFGIFFIPCWLAPPTVRFHWSSWLNLFLAVVCYIVPHLKKKKCMLCGFQTSIYIPNALRSTLKKANLHCNCLTVHINLYILSCAVYDFIANHLAALRIKPTSIKYLLCFCFTETL